MKSNKALYVGVLVLGVVIIAGLRYARYNDVDVPAWGYLLVVAVGAAFIAFDVWRRKGSAAPSAEAEKGRVRE